MAKHSRGGKRGSSASKANDFTFVMPTLTGTDKQIKYAQDIINKTRHFFDPYIAKNEAHAKKYPVNRESDEFENSKYLAAIRAFEGNISGNNSTAKEIIEHKDYFRLIPNDYLVSLTFDYETKEWIMNWTDDDKEIIGHYKDLLKWGKTR